MKPRVAPRHPAFGLFVIAITAIAISSYVLERPRQSEFESRGIGRIASWLRLHEALYPGVRVTNVSQLFGEVSNGYPYFLHEQFRMFGKHAGFENSIAEKYVFLDPPIPLASCEIVFISAQPYPTRDGLERSSLCKAGDHHEIRHWPEAWIQNQLRQVQRSIPSPARATKVSPPGPDRLSGSEPFWEGISIFFSRLEWRGIPAGYLPAIKRSVMAAMWLLVCAALVFAFWQKTVIDFPAKDPIEPPLSHNAKVMCVTVWTIGVSVFVILWAMTPTVGDSETLSHVVFPYWMIGYYWHGRGAGWMLLPIALQFPLYGWIVACAWKDNRLLGGMTVVTSAHVGAMLLAVFMAATRY